MIAWRHRTCGDGGRIVKVLLQFRNVVLLSGDAVGQGSFGIASTCSEAVGIIGKLLCDGCG
ncbi:MAG: hypothetical protein ACK559_41530, partial [bacterium]